MVALVQSALSYVIPFLFVLLVVITVHEFGHFLMARAFGVAIDRFSIGFGRALLSWRDRAGIEWRIGWIPIGGYVMFAGDENAASVPDQNDLEDMRRRIVAHEGPAAVRKYLPFKPLWQRALVAAAGPAANFLLSIAIFAVLFMAFGQLTLRPRVGAVLPRSAAAAAGFQVGDLITRADGRPVDSFEQLHEIVSLRTGVPMHFTVRRGAVDLVLNATPRRSVVDDPVGGHDDQGLLGLAPSTAPSDIVRRGFDPISAVGAGAARTWDILSTTVYYLGRIAQGRESGQQITGVIGIAQVSHFAMQEGARGELGLRAQVLGSLVMLFNLVALVSVSIGFANLLPIPVLDGGHLLFYAYEGIARRPVATSVQAVSYRVGLALLLGLMLFATTNDLQRIHVFRFLGGLFS
ncbi:MAG TPA: M50 family metallopeptidase [Caulobacteraceae bacterium]|jgi:regulator of sigma E protease|nr:M50 family metallopeptidase [Caulobacteraceae bacterium]